MDWQTMLGGLGGRELILMTAIALLLATASRFNRLQPVRPIAGGQDGAEEAASRRYLDRLLGPSAVQDPPRRPSPLPRSVDE